MNNCRLFVPSLFLLSALAGTASTPSSLVLSSSINPSALGQSITLTAKVSPGGATGKVTFYDGSTILGTRTVAGGQAALITTLLPSGGRSLKAHYEGDATYQPSTSPSLAQAVNAVEGFGFNAPVGYSGGSGYGGSAIADFNGDGKADLALWAISSRDPVYVLLGNGDGTFQTATSFPISQILWGVVPGDFNGDGRMDLLVDAGGMSFFAGRGDGTFDPPVVLNLPGGPWAVGDFNGDGIADIASVQAGILTVLLGKGDGTFQNTGSVVASQGFGFIAVNDFNGDGKADLAVGGWADCCFEVFLGNGDGTFRAALSFPLTEVDTAFAVGDFNRDGKLDVALANRGTIAILTGNGDGTFRQTGTYPADFFGLLSVGDFNADGVQDLAFSNFNGDGINLLVGKGDGTFAPTLQAVNPPVCFLVAAEFNADGRTDLLANARNSSSEILVLLGQPLLTANALFNPGAESLLLGWSGAGFAATSTAPHSGAESFYATQNANLYGSQTISLLTFPNVTASDIDAGVLAANYSYWYKNRTSATGGRYQITLTFYSQPPTRVGQGLSVLRQGSLTWTNDSGSLPIPPQTRYIVYTMDFFGTTDTGQFDDNALTVSRRFPSPNLLSDPGAESGLLASPWWPNLGSPAIVDGPTYFGTSGGAPHSGTYMFYGGPVANAYISQTVDLLPLGFVDPLHLSAKYSCWFTDRAANPGSIGAVTLTFEDVNHLVVGRNVSSGAKGTAWVNLAGTIPVPSTTRYIVYTMNFAGPSGTPATGVFDDNSLVIDLQ